jgi:flagella basal body P-ring formation protein FlgA
VLGKQTLCLLAWLASSAPLVALGDRQTVDPAEIRRAIESAWADVAPASSQLEVRALPVLRFDGDSAEIDVSLPDPLDLPGPRVITVSCRVGDRVVARGLASAIIRVRTSIWIAARDLREGDVLDAASIESMDRVQERTDVRLFRPETGRRYRLAHDVATGSTIETRDVVRVPDVESGTQIKLVSRVGTAAVEVTGSVRRSGDVGDTILVQNPITNTLVRARVLDANTAELIDHAAPVRKDERKRLS